MCKLISDKGKKVRLDLTIKLTFMTDNGARNAIDQLRKIEHSNDWATGWAKDLADLIENK